jgi:hypothetical protein
MKIALLICAAAVVSPVLEAQAPPAKPLDVQKDIQIDIQNPIQPLAAVPVKNEPHHALMLQNDYVRVFNVTVPPLDATLLHRHDVPYLYLTLGRSDVINAVQGKPEAHLIFQDGDTRYSPGGFAHIARTDAGILFHNITIELLHPQDSPRNLPGNPSDRPLGACPAASGDPKQNNQIPFEQVTGCFETDELRMDVVHVEGGKDYIDSSPQTAALLVAMSDANLDVSLGGEHTAFLHTGDVMWLPATTSRKVGDFLGIKSKFLLISFKDSAITTPK